MTDLLQWGLGLIAWMQQYRSLLTDELMQHTSDFGGKYFMYFLPVLLWCLNFRFMVRIATLLILSFFINISFKDFLALPRPFDIDPTITSHREWGYGMPSGHAQNSALLWILLAVAVGKRWFWLMAVAIALLIGLSRLYLGLHFPGDIIGGWLLAAVLLWAYYAWGDKTACWLEQQRSTLLVKCFTVGLAGFYFLYACILDMPVMAGLVAISFGAATGTIAAIRAFDYQGFGSYWQRLLRGLIGVCVLVVYIESAAHFLPAVRSATYYWALLIGNTLAGLWLTLGAPMVFSLLALDGHQKSKN